MTEPVLNLPRDLGDGLRLRTATEEDADRLSLYNSIIHSDEGPDQPDQRVAAWIRDLLSGEHPTFSPSDFTIVEEIETGRIVSSMNLISQEWEYAGVPFKVGRPELVGTLPEYRRRGLIRLQFDMIHRWSRERGQLVQAITGIPNYYRQFGYEMGMNLGGGRIGYQPQVPSLGEGQTEPFHLRPATQEDLPFIVEVYDFGRKRSLVSAVWGEDLWRYELFGKSEMNVNRPEVAIIETAAGEKIGILGYEHTNLRAISHCRLYELKPGVSWWAVTPSVIRFLWKIGGDRAKSLQEEVVGFGLWLGQEHPAYKVTADRLPRVRNPYAWYLRVPDLPCFLMQIAPVLEKRLANSVCIGFSGELKLNFYQSGLCMEFADGRLLRVTPWQPSTSETGSVSFPELTFLQLVFGYRTLQELRYEYADCMVSDEKWAPVLDELFPKQSSNVFPIS